MIRGKNFVSTGFKPRKSGGWWHLLLAVRKKFRIAYITPNVHPEYRRLYIGWIEIEWSKL